MERFRVLSDLHIDVNKKHPFSMTKDGVFNVICGDVSGDPTLTTAWLRDNVSKGVFIAGNHLPYCNHPSDDDEVNIRLMSELRQELADNFPKTADISYLDVLTGCFSKEVDGILFVGTTMYTNMRISHEWWNPSGDRELNMQLSRLNMNDYYHGFTKREYPFGADNDPTYVQLKPEDYYQWFVESFDAIDTLLKKNETLENPKPVVLMTHHPIIKDFFDHNYYLDDSQWIERQKYFNWASYASDLGYWFDEHPSIKCYCCGHIHDPEPAYRSFKIARKDGSEILVVNNTRGYVFDNADLTFNPNRFVNTTTWEFEEEPEDEKTRKEK